MSDALKHECGLAYIRLKKPLSFYYRKYGTAFYGLNKLYLLMEKQHNRGQDGAGVAALKLNMEAGNQFLHRLRKNGQHGLRELWNHIFSEVEEIERSYPDIRQYPGLLKGYYRFMGEVLLGHLRYGTQGKNDVEYCHPFIRTDINPTRCLSLAGNFNLVNREELFAQIQSNSSIEAMKESDLGAMIETFYQSLCEADQAHPEDLDVKAVIKNAASKFDGGYVAAGLIGNGDSFVVRDPNGIRPAFYYENEEIVVAASERPAIMTAFKLNIEDVKELPRGAAIIVKNNGQSEIAQVLEPRDNTACSFERIYFSRGGDADIYTERMQLGKNTAAKVLEELNNDLKNTIVSFIPNTAETAFYGLIKGLEDYLLEIKLQRILSKGKDMSEDEMRELINRRVRIEKVAIKDVKMRTFITEDASRNEMVQHVYDITYGTVNPGVDNLVVIDDSIVRGTTLRESIIKMLDRLEPKKIIIVSSAPQIRYPDCYGIDMSKMGEFIAFQAAIALLKERGMQHVIDDVYQKCKTADAQGDLIQENFVKAIYAPFTDEDISAKIATMLHSEDVKAELSIIFQDIEGLHQACPEHKGDWYFTGNYPTPGGNRVANRAFIKYIEKDSSRGY